MLLANCSVEIFLVLVRSVPRALCYQYLIILKLFAVDLRATGLRRLLIHLEHKNAVLLYDWKNGKPGSV